MRKQPRRQTNHALFPVALVVAVTVIGIVATIANPRISPVARRAVTAALESTAENVRTAVGDEYRWFPRDDAGRGTADPSCSVTQRMEPSNRNGATAPLPGPRFSLARHEWKG